MRPEGPPGEAPIPREMGTTRHTDPAQARAALRLARERRSARARFRRSLTPERAAALLRAAVPPAWAMSWPVGAFLESVPELGPVRAGLVLEAVQAQERLTLGELGAERRRALAACIERACARHARPCRRDARRSAPGPGYGR